MYAISLPAETSFNNPSRPKPIWNPPNRERFHKPRSGPKGDRIFLSIIVCDESYVVLGFHRLFIRRSDRVFVFVPGDRLSNAIDVRRGAEIECLLEFRRIENIFALALI